MQRRISGYEIAARVIELRPRYADNETEQERQLRVLVAYESSRRTRQDAAQFEQAIADTESN